MNRIEVLRLLSDCINDADKAEAFGIGDKLLEVIAFLKEDWKIADEDIPEREANAERPADASWDDNLLWNKLKEHAGNTVEIAVYGDWDDPVSICLEDIDTSEVILDAELYTLAARQDV